MKTALSIYATMLLVSANAFAAKSQILCSCDLGLESKLTVTVLARNRNGDSATVYLRIGKKSMGTPLFADQEPEESRGQPLFVRCAGDTEKVLVVAGEFGSSNYLKGLALRYHDGQLQRLRFAEHALPSRAYLDGEDMLLYVPQPYPDREPPWIVYRYDASTEDVEPTSATELPTERRYLEIKLR